MKAYVLTESGPRLIEREPPAVRPYEVRVRVRACALNRVDLAMIHGHVHGGAGGVGAVLGVEWAGDVEALGDEVEGFAIGERVMGSGAGAFAELTTVDATRALRIPDGLSYEDAAALPVALQTMHDALITNGRFTRGDAVLVQGASSGVGLMAVQIARHFGARLVVGTSTSADKRERLRTLGVGLALDAQDASWVEQVLAATEGKGVDVAIDNVSGALVTATMRATRVGGRIVNVGRLGGMKAEIDFDLHALRRITYTGVTFRTRSRDELREVTRKTQQDLGDALAQGALRLPVDRVFTLDEVVAALAYMRENRHFGKIVLRV